jgi:M6 family metalloprotease-like protein
MEKTFNKKTFVFFAFLLSVICITIIALSPVAGKNNQLASVSAALKTDSNLNKDISGKRVIGVTVVEDFLHEHESKEKIDEKYIKVIKEIFIDGKKYYLETDNIPSEIKSGIYDVKGTLDTKTNIVTITDAKFLGTLFDGVRDAQKVGTGTSSKVPPKKLAVFLFDYQDTATQPFYPSDINQIMFGDGKFKRYFEEASYGRQSITGDVFGWYTIPRSSSNLCQAMPETDLAQFLQGNNQVNLNNYTNIVLITLCNGSVANGLSNTGPQPYNIGGTVYNKTISWVNISSSMWNQPSIQMSESMSGPHTLTNLEHILVHEFGHALGLHHAHGISCEGVVPETECEDVPLGNYYDVMAYDTIGLHINAWTKAKLGWFNSGELKTITQSGIYNLVDLASPPGILSLNQAKAYKIKPSINSNKTPIWIEFRNAYGFDNGINTPAFGGMYTNQAPTQNVSENKQGIMIYKEAFDPIFYGAINPKTAKLMYLRNSPNLINANPYQVSLNPGQTYTEPRYGLTITALNSLNPNSRRFQVQMNPNLECQFVSPELKAFSFGSLENVQPGTGLSISIYTKNMDYISCPSSNFQMDIDYSVFQPNGAGSSIPALLSNLSPDDERHISRGIWVPAGTPPGTYNLSVTMTNVNSGLSTNFNLPITVN